VSGYLITDGHLGGYMSGGDPNTMYPSLWEWLVELTGARSVLDVGCGDGAALRVFRELGVPRAIGVDGIAQEDREIIQHDFSLGQWVPLHPVDLVWSCEFVEHVEAEYLPNFMPALTCGRFLAMTHAVPGQTGYHHVNCQSGEWWVERVEAAGMSYDPELTRHARATVDIVAENYFAHTGLIFRREP
jgi:SAM-dependent methyltransferase